MSIPRKASRRLVAASLTGMLALTACSGAEGSSSDEESIHIVGFAVPEAANKTIADGVRQDRRRQGREVRDLVRRLRRPEPGRRGRPRGRLRPLLGPDRRHPPGRRRASSPTTGTTARTRASSPPRSSCSASARATRKNIQTWDDLDQARRRDRDARTRPRRVRPAGTRSPPTARSSSDGGTEEEADRVRRRRSSRTSSRCPSSGRDATTAFLGGTGDVLMAYENEAILAAPERRGASTTSSRRPRS